MEVGSHIAQLQRVYREEATTCFVCNTCIALDKTITEIICVVSGPDLFSEGGGEEEKILALLDFAASRASY